jgi:hypothetical protein
MLFYFYDNRKEKAGLLRPEWLLRRQLLKQKRKRRHHHQDHCKKEQAKKISDPISNQS